MIHPITGVKLARGIRSAIVRYGDLEATIDLPGWYAADGGAEPVYDGPDLRAYSDAWARLAGEGRNGTADLVRGVAEAA